MLGGGFPEGRIILVSGGPGSGKTLFSFQFLIEAVKRGEPGVYVTLEEQLSFIKQNVASFGWNIEKAEKENMLRLLDYCVVPLQGGGYTARDNRNDTPRFSFVDELIRSVEAIKGKHIVIDPISSVAIHQTQASMKRYEIAKIFRDLRKSGCNSIVTSEVLPEPSNFYMEEYLADGVVVLNKTFKDFRLLKYIWIEKMRGIKYDEQIRPYDITSEGIIAYPTESVKPQ